jgi:DNA polymerase III gamma/tau subunit
VLHALTVTAAACAACPSDGADRICTHHPNSADLLKPCAAQIHASLSCYILLHQHIRGDCRDGFACLTTPSPFPLPSVQQSIAEGLGLQERASEHAAAASSTHIIAPAGTLLEQQAVATTAEEEAEERAKREAEEREAEEKDKKEAEEKNKKEAEEMAKREAEEKTKKEAEEMAKKEAEETKEKAEKEAQVKAVATDSDITTAVHSLPSPSLALSFFLSLSLPLIFTPPEPPSPSLPLSIPPSSFSPSLRVSQRFSHHFRHLPCIP